MHEGDVMLLRVTSSGGHGQMVGNLPTTASVPSANSRRRWMYWP